MWTDAQLLHVWERGYSASPMNRAVLLASLAIPDQSFDQLIDLPIGYRDGYLIALRKQLFGSQVTSTAMCPECDTKLELSIDLEPLISLVSTYSNPSFEFQNGDSRMQVRLPTTRDLQSVSQFPAEDRANAILNRCLNDSISSLASSSIDLKQQLSNELEERDPLAQIEYSMSCLDCEKAFITTFDVVSFLWSELNAWCQRLMSEIHLLARAYGWSEEKILNLSAWRRQVYLNMVRQ